MRGAIDRLSPVPLWFQLALILEREIDAGRWEAGERLPSEHELCERYALSRAPVRQAMRRLEQEGLVVRRKGFGTYVRETRLRSWLLQSADGFFGDEVDRLGRQVESQVLRQEVAPLPDWATDALGVAPGATGVNIERLRSVDGLIALYVEEHLPASLAEVIEQMDVARDSLYGQLRRAGREVAGARRVLQAVNANDRLAGLLEVDVGAPLVVIESLAWDQALEPFHCFRTWLRTDRMRIEVQVVPTSSAATPSAAEPATSTSPKEQQR